MCGKGTKTMLFDSLTVLEFYQKKHDIYGYGSKRGILPIDCKAFNPLILSKGSRRAMQFLGRQNSAENLQVYNPQGE